MESGSDFDGHTWSRTVSTNNDFPHAPWWSHQSRQQSATGRTYNPTAALAGFALQYSQPGSRLQALAKQIAAESFHALQAMQAVEVHELSCFLRLLRCVRRQETDIGVDLAKVQKLLEAQVNAAITRDTSRWKTEYVCRPSRFVHRRTDPLFAQNEDIIRYECNFIKQTQLEDGTWPVTWAWSAFPDEWPLAREWWKAAIIIENLLFLKSMPEL